MQIRFTQEAPGATEFQRLYGSTGWAGGVEREPEFYARALAGSWAQCAAYDGEELVGFGRVISDGVLHAFITEMIVLPAQGLLTRRRWAALPVRKAAGKAQTAAGLDTRRGFATRPAVFLAATLREGSAQRARRRCSAGPHASAGGTPRLA